MALDELAEAVAERSPTRDSATYCRSCDYDLRGLPAGSCPECGRPFDPHDRGTFHGHSRYRRHGRTATYLSMYGLCAIVSVGLFLLTGVLGILIGLTVAMFVTHAQSNRRPAWRRKQAGDADVESDSGVPAIVPVTFFASVLFSSFAIAAIYDFRLFLALFVLSVVIVSIVACVHTGRIGQRPQKP